MKNKTQSILGCGFALITIMIWGTTFTSTKILLLDFKPVEILFFRFLLGYLALFLACPRPLKLPSVRQEAVFALAGLCGICLYYLLEKYPVILTTRRTFFYGILFMVPALFFFDFQLRPERFGDITCLLNMVYLGLGASALCFVTWNTAVRLLGAVRTSVYIYMVPVITVATSALILREPVTWISAAGTLLAVAGLFLSEYRGKG